MKLKRLDFLVIGTQKGGTTAVDYYLRQNPSLLLSHKRKEIHFFDNDSLDWENPKYEGYHSYFDWSSEACFRGEVTPIYMYWPQSVERIRNYNPDIKLIVLLRNPIFRAYSHWRMERARGIEMLSFSKAIRDGRNRIANPQFLRFYDYVERGFYSSQVARILANFPHEQILFLTSDFLRESFLLAMDNIASFLGARPFLDLVPKFISPIEDRSAYGLNPEDIAFLSELFRKDIIQTSVLTGLDLTSWLDAGYSEPVIFVE